MKIVSTRWIAYLALVLLYLLHNDLWFWNDSRIIMGLPIGLLYHVCFCFGSSILMFILIRFCWPVPRIVNLSDTQTSQQERVSK